MTNLPSFLAILLMFTINAHAIDPAWNVRDAAEKLLDKHALRQPVDDWFLERKDGSLVQYFKPSIIYSGGGSFWHAEVRTAKWRERKNGAWGPWATAPSKPGYFQTASIEISTPSTGGASARFNDVKGWFLPFRAPGQSRVTHVR